MWRDQWVSTSIAGPMGASATPGHHLGGQSDIDITTAETLEPMADRFRPQEEMFQFQDQRFRDMENDVPYEMETEIQERQGPAVPQPGTVDLQADRHLLVQQSAPPGFSGAGTLSPPGVVSSNVSEPSYPTPKTRRGGSVQRPPHNMESVKRRLIDQLNRNHPVGFTDVEGDEEDIRTITRDRDQLNMDIRNLDGLSADVSDKWGSI